MKSPIERARYILNINGIKILEENKSSIDVKDNVLDPSIMIEMFQIREQIEESINNNDELKVLQNNLNIKINIINKQLQNSLDNNDLILLTNTAVRLKYLSKALDEVNNFIK